jgi:hypothetical protein
MNKDMAAYLDNARDAARRKGWTPEQWDAFQVRAIARGRDGILEAVAEELRVAPTAAYRAEDETCERGTPGCSALHAACSAETDCATW